MVRLKPMSEVIVYSLPSEVCRQCRTTKMILDKMGVGYEEVRIDLDESAAEYIKSLGYKQAPVVVVDKGNHWSGLDPVRLATLA